MRMNEILKTVGCRMDWTEIELRLVSLDGETDAEICTSIDC